MAGKRLVDLAALVGAARGVARQHVALRSQQVEIYSQTSSLAKAVRSQTERITETAKAASILASRLNEEPPAWTRDIVSTEERDYAATRVRPAAGQHEPSEKATALQSNGMIDIERNGGVQESSDTIVIPEHIAEGIDKHSISVLDQGHDQVEFYQRTEHTVVNATISKGNIPEHVSCSQLGVDQLSNMSPASDSYYSTTDVPAPDSIPSLQAVPEQDQVPSGINTDVFQSSRISQLLGGKSKTSERSSLKLKGALKTPIDHTGLSNGRDQDTFNVRTSNQTSSSSVNSVIDLASQQPTEPMRETVETPKNEHSKETDSTRLENTVRGTHITSNFH